VLETCALLSGLCSEARIEVVLDVHELNAAVFLHGTRKDTDTRTGGPS
jgi:hypothetical protein